MQALSPIPPAELATRQTPAGFMENMASSWTFLGFHQAVPWITPPYVVNVSRPALKGSSQMQTKWITVASLVGVLCAGTAAAAVNTTVLNSASPDTTLTNDALKIVDQGSTDADSSTQAEPSAPKLSPTAKPQAVSPDSSWAAGGEATRVISEQSGPVRAPRSAPTRRPRRDSDGGHSASSDSPAGSTSRPDDGGTTGQPPSGDDHSSGSNGGSAEPEHSGGQRDD